MPTEKSDLLPDAKGAGRPVDSGTILALEGLRGVLMTLILTFHFQMFARGESGRVPCDSPAECAWSNLLELNGNSLVDYFFVISGFLAALSNRPPPAGCSPLWRGMAGKFLRLAPIYYVSIAILIFMYWLNGTDCVPAYSLAAQLLMLQAWFPIGHLQSPALFCGNATTTLGSAVAWRPPAPAHWFVSALLGVFLVHSLIGERLVRLCGPWLSLFNAVFFAVVRGLCKAPVLNRLLWPYNITWRLIFPLFHVPEFLAGAFAAQLVNQLPEDGVVRTWRGWQVVDSVCVILLSVFLCLPSSSRGTANAPMLGGFFVWEMVQLPLVVLLLLCMRMKHEGIALRGLATMAALGPISYGAYCFQFVVLRLQLMSHWSLRSWPSAIFFLAATWLLAGLATHYVDTPFRSVSKHWLKAGCFASASDP